MSKQRPEAIDELAAQVERGLEASWATYARGKVRAFLAELAGGGA